ncbi:MAG: MFS transporter, partial [Chloroflexi bacterium]
MRLRLQPTPIPTSTGEHDDSSAPLRYRDFRLLLIGRFIASLGDQMLSFAIGWELWLRTHDELALGMVGLVQVIPVLLFSLPGGHVADQYNRKRIIIFGQSMLAVCSFSLMLLSLVEGPIALIYACLFGIGLARAFNNPATSTLLPQTVPPHLFTRAATWSASVWQLAAIIGPAFAGGFVALIHNVTPIYLLDSMFNLTFLAAVLMIKGRPLALARKAATLDSLKEGIRFIRSTQEILAAITLDMFAVRLGGAVMLLPVYATDVLKVGPEGLGIMRAAPSIGAMLMALSLTQLPPFRHAGRTLLWAVAGFGVATIIFGLSRSFWLSVVMLFALGALDNISVVIRATLILVRTPDEMRGRTSAVNSIFIGASNELGGFESGAAAALIGPVAAVVGGGIGTILVVLGVAKVFPELLNLRSL